MSGKIAVIRIKGQTNLRKEIKYTLDLLGLDRKFSCVVLDGTPSILGMMKKLKDSVTFGELNEETFSLLKEKRGKKTKDKEGKEIHKKFYRLHPPKGGFERKGTKVAFAAGGVLGDRKEKINELIKRMI
jgi:large subunit ribosomal protein L30